MTGTRAVPTRKSGAFSKRIPRYRISLHSPLTIGNRRGTTAVTRNLIDPSKFNREALLPYELRCEDFQSAMQDAYDFFFDVNCGLVGKGLDRLDETLRPAIRNR